MGFFKDPAERAASDAVRETRKEERAAAKAAAREATDRRREEQRFRRSPAGRARAALERGDGAFVIELVVDDDAGRELTTIEALGWRLDHVSFVPQTTVTSTSNDVQQLSSIDGYGRVLGVYLFRSR